MLIGAEKDESPENRIKRTTFMLLILITGTAAIGWASIYILGATFSSIYSVILFSGIIVESFISP